MDSLSAFLDYIGDHAVGILVIGGVLLAFSLVEAFKKLVEIAEHHFAEEEYEEEEEDEGEEDEEENDEEEENEEPVEDVVTKITIDEVLETLYVAGRGSLGRAYTIEFRKRRLVKTFPRRSRFTRG